MTLILAFTFAVSDLHCAVNAVDGFVDFRRVLESKSNAIHRAQVQRAFHGGFAVPGTGETTFADQLPTDYGG